MDLEVLAERVRRCRKCPLWKTRNRAVPGEGNPSARIFLVGEAPGREEDRLGRPFAGAAGKILNDALERAGFGRDNVFITSVLRCRPPGNRNPRKIEVEKCQVHLVSYIEAVDPLVVVALGSIAHRVLAGKPAKVSDARMIDREYRGRRLFSTYHPAAVLYNRRLMTELVADLEEAHAFVNSESASVISMLPQAGKRDVLVDAAGGVIHRDRKILLIRKRSERLWCLPKGHIEEGESPDSAARREMKEETGLLSITIEQELCEVEYAYYWPQDDVNYRKRVKYFLAHSSRGRPELEPRFDEYRWCTESDSVSLLTYRNDIVVTREAFKLIS